MVVWIFGGLNYLRVRYLVIKVVEIEFLMSLVMKNGKIRGLCYGD